MELDRSDQAIYFNVLIDLKTIEEKREKCYPYHISNKNFLNYNCV